MLSLRHLFPPLVALALLAAQTASGATVTLDLTTLGTFSLAAGQAETISLGGSTTTANGVTTIVSPLIITLSAMTASGRTGLQAHNVTVGGTDVNEITNYNLTTTTGNGSVKQDIYQSSLNFSASGAGVTNTLEMSRGRAPVPTDSPAVDGGGGNVDFLGVALSQASTLSGVTFTDFNLTGNGKSKSQFEWAWDSNADGRISNGDILSGKINLSAVNATTFASTTSQTFAFSATGNNDSWDLSSLTFSYVPTIQIRYGYSSVPLPAAGLLLLSALGGLGFLRRRRS